MDASSLVVQIKCDDQLSKVLEEHRELLERIQKNTDGLLYRRVGDLEVLSIPPVRQEASLSTSLIALAGVACASRRKVSRRTLFGLRRREA